MSELEAMHILNRLMITRKRPPVNQSDSRPLEITDDTSPQLDLSTISVNINSFEYNTPISIISSTTNQSISYYQEKAILSNTVTKWLIETDISDTSICYIKAAVPSTHGRQYLGAPNSDNKVYLYTSRNCFTQWNLSLMDKDTDLYKLTYVGRKFDSSHVQLVIARYSEDIRWVRAYKDIAIVYNKGIYHDTLDTLNVIQLENIGREGHTYLHHMITAYDSLKERTIFSQGDPFSHNDTFLFAIDNCDKLDDVMPLGLGYLVNNDLPPQKLLDKIKQKTDYGLEYAIFKINKNCDYMNESYFYDAGALGFVTTYRSYYKIEQSLSIIESMLRRSKFPYFPNDTFYFSFSGLFAVNRAAIKAHDIEVYINLKEELLSENNQGGVNGYLLERLWLHIFNGYRYEKYTKELK